MLQHLFLLGQTQFYKSPITRGSYLLGRSFWTFLSSSFLSIWAPGHFTTNLHNILSLFVFVIFIAFNLRRHHGGWKQTIQEIFWRSTHLQFLAKKPSRLLLDRFKFYSVRNAQLRIIPFGGVLIHSCIIKHAQRARTIYKELSIHIKPPTKSPTNASSTRVMGTLNNIEIGEFFQKWNKTKHTYRDAVKNAITIWS